MKRHRTPHTAWCARDHQCGVAEHRSPEMVVDLPGCGRSVITRVRAGDVEYAEIRTRLVLHQSDTGARWQLTTVLRLMHDLLRQVAIRPGVLRDPTRPAVDRRTAA